MPRQQRQQEVDAAVAAVRSAARMCVGVQGRLRDGATVTKGDDSPVTAADFAAQALVGSVLSGALGDIAMVGEEDHDDLRTPERSTLLDAVVGLVGEELGGAVSEATVLDWISIGSADGSGDRYWTLDPIDGTKGFLRGDQYAIALALVERGEVVVGVLGCPNLPNPDGSVGALFVAAEGECVAYYGDSSAPTPVRSGTDVSMADARFCESVESAHSDQDQSVQVAAVLGIGQEPYRIDSQCKYGAVARGDASIYLRLPTRVGYREKIWDHAAGKYVVECAGGQVSDVLGAPLDFTTGRTLERNRGVIATAGVDHAEVVDAVIRVLGPDGGPNSR